MTESIRPIPNGSIIWKMGQMWGILPPNSDGDYLTENVRYTTFTPNGITDTYFGKGSFRRSLQIIGTPPSNLDANVNIGCFTAHISIINGQPNMEIRGGKEAVIKRWTMERSNPKPHKMDDEINQFTISTRARRAQEQALWEYLRSEIYIRDKGICWICKGFVLLKDYDLGHLVDRSNSGNDSMENCAVMHKLCNNAKPRHKTIAEVLAWQSKPRNLAHNYKPKLAPAEQPLLISNTRS